MRPEGPGVPSGQARQELLLRMYDQMWNNINRHITVVWQSVGVLVAAFAVYAAVGERLVSLDVATFLLVITAAWLIANVYDASSWYNRNQAIIVNIEKLFLYPEDLRNVHPYFAAHRQPGDMLRHLRVQLYLGYGIAAAVLLYHFSEQVLPTLDVEAPIDPAKVLPYGTATTGLVFLYCFRRRTEADLREFSQWAPGVPIAAQTEPVTAPVAPTQPTGTGGIETPQEETPPAKQ